MYICLVLCSVPQGPVKEVFPSTGAKPGIYNSTQNSPIFSPSHDGGTAILDKNRLYIYIYILSIEYMGDLVAQQPAFAEQSIRRKGSTGQSVSYNSWFGAPGV